jgi:hypothetical protein
MTSLQQTAMGGGAATAKTASYVLVAADAGTTVAMNAAGATTITVNTGLFAAGDTVFIQNLGAGACTVTAGTATVATAGSLILPQNDAGILYFTATGAAIFYDYIQAGAVSPLTTKGDLYTFSTSDARLAVGTNGTTLVADSSEATGLKWATPAGGSNFSLLNSGGTALNPNASVTISGISGKDKILVMVTAASPDSGSNNAFPRLRLNSDTGSNYYFNGFLTIGNSTYSSASFISMSGNPDTSFPLARFAGGSGVSECFAYALFTGCNSSGVKTVQISGGATQGGSTEQRSHSYGGYYSGSSTISSITLFADGAFTNYDAGTIYVYTSA